MDPSSTGARWATVPSLPGWAFSAHSFTDGWNTFAIEKTCGNCLENFTLAVDLDSGSQSSDRRDGGGELMWTLRVQVEQSYESLERYITEEYVNDDGSREYAHRQEAYIYERDFDSYYSVQREARDGTRDGTWMATMRWKQDEYWGNQEKNFRWEKWGCHRRDSENPYPHCQVVGDHQTRFDQANHGGDQPHMALDDPVEGTHYDWYETWLESWDAASNERTEDYYVQLKTNRTPEDNGVELKIKSEATAEACNGSTSDHPHTCFWAGFELVDLGREVSSFEEATVKSKKIADWVIAVQNTGGNWNKATKAMAKAPVLGFLVTWLYESSKEGQLVGAFIDEFDRDDPVFGRTHWTVTSTIPSAHGWIVPFDPQVLHHWLPEDTFQHGPHCWTWTSQEDFQDAPC